MKYKNSTILLFAKTPILGQVKTRLEPVLGQLGALHLHKALIEQLLRTVHASELAAVELWVSSNKTHEYFLSLCNLMNLREENLHEQDGCDLGARMAGAAREGLKRAGSVVLLGADCPAVDAAYLDQALHLLESGQEIVFGPAQDGGYVLLGLRSVPLELFRDMPWGSAEVMALSRQRLQESGKTWVELPESWDVDRPEDLARLRKLMPQLTGVLDPEGQVGIAAVIEQ
jgi:uncharacterized protein